MTDQIPTRYRASRTRILPLLLAGLVVAAGAAAPSGSGKAVSIWSGGYTLPLGAHPVAITLFETGRQAVVSLGPGHASADRVLVTEAAGMLRFHLPGRPAVLSFVGRVRGSVVAGSVRQGSTRGKFRMTGVARRPVDSALGTYGLASGGAIGLADYRRLSLPVWAIDYTSGSFHALRRSGSTFAAGPSVLASAPAVGQVSIVGDRLIWAPDGGASVSGTRLAVKQYEVRFASGKAVLAGTLSVPIGQGRHPAVAIVHGSGPALRDEGQFVTGLFLEHGIAVLAYDKRGNGESTGTYPGELATGSAINAYADDAQAAVHFLSEQPDLDPHRLGLFGGSQGGWIVPLAAARSTLVSFAVIQSGPTVTVGETADFSSRTTQGAAPLSQPLAQIEAQVKRDGPSGFDPKPWIRRLEIPILWLYGGLDMNQPSHLDLQVLDLLKAETGHDYSWHLYPNGNHGIFEVKTGLNAELTSSRGMPAAFFTDVADWLHVHGISSR